MDHCEKFMIDTSRQSTELWNS